VIAVKRFGAQTVMCGESVLVASGGTARAATIEGRDAVELGKIV